MKKWLLGFIGLSLFLMCNPDDGITPTPQNTEDPCGMASVVTKETPYEINLPDHFPQLPTHILTGLTKEKVALGRMLFYDPILSGDSTMACASCHQQEHSFTDPKPFSVGIDGIPSTRNSMSLVNLAFSRTGFFWEGRSETLQAQALIPVEDPIELHAEWPTVVGKIKNTDRYQRAFKEAYPINTCDSITKELVADALARFQSTIISSDSKFDRVKSGKAFFTDKELVGFDKFFDFTVGVKDAECGHCHTDPLFTSNQFFNNGLQEANTLDDFADMGRGLVTNNKIDNGFFKAPTLRNIFYTAPYMHNSAFNTLEEVLNHYSKGGKRSPNKDPLIYPTELSEEDISDLVAFLRTLTDTSVLTNPAFSNPFE